MVGFLILIVSTVANCQVPVTYGGYTQRSGLSNEIKYTLNESFIVYDGDTLRGYWNDSTFVSKRREFTFSNTGVEERSKLFPVNVVWKECTLEYGDYPYWSLHYEHSKGVSFAFLCGYTDIGETASIRILVEDITFYPKNKLIKGLQNGLPFQLSNPTEDGTF